MPRLPFTSQRALPFTLVLTGAAALLPPAALGWTEPPSELFRLVMLPFVDGGNRLGHWIRPARSATAVNADLTEEYVEKLLDEAEDFRRLYLAEQAKVQELEEQVRQLQGFASDHLKTPVNPLLARIGLRSPISAAGTVTLNRGSSSGVKSGTIAVYNQVHLVGRVTNDVSSVQCQLLPLTHRGTGPLDCVVLPKDHLQVSLASAPRVQLMPDGNGSFAGQIDRLKIVNPGDEVRLFGDDWPASAKGMIVGTIEAVSPNDMEPLRNTIIVRPAFQVSQLSTVVLRIELDEATADAGSAGTGDAGGLQ